MARSDYSNQLEIILPARPQGYAQGELVEIRFETRTAIAQGQMRRDWKDLRVFYGEVEIDRILRETGKIRFALQAAVSSNTEVNGYWLSYGRPSETTEALQDPRGVYPFYSNGNDLNKWNKTGTVNTFSFAAPGFIKHSGPPQFPAPSPPQYGTRDAWGFKWEDSTQKWWLFFGTGPATSPDLYNWTFEPWPIIAESPRPPTNGGVLANLSPLHRTMVDGQMKWVGVAMNGDLDPPWYLEGLTADQIAGPWTWYRQLVPADMSYDAATTGAGGIWQLPTGEWMNVYGCESDTQGGLMQSYRGVAIAIAPPELPMGPFVKYGPIADPSTEELENPEYIYDSTNTIHYITATHAGRNSAVTWFDFLNCIPMYWNTNANPRTGWSADYQTTIVEPEHDRWDSLTIGMPSNFAIDNGVAHIYYDGGDLAAYMTDYPVGNNGRSIGGAQARWPFAWSTAINLADGASITATNLLSGDGVIQARVRFRSEVSSYIEFSIGTDTYRVYAETDTMDGDGFVTIDNPLYFKYNNTAGVSTGPERALGHTKTIRVERTGTGMQIYWSGWKIWEGTVATSSIGVKIGGNTVVEELLVETPLNVFSTLTVIEITPPTALFDLTSLTPTTSIFSPYINIYPPTALLDLLAPIPTSSIIGSGSNLRDAYGSALPMLVFDGSTFINVGFSVFDGITFK